MFEPSLIDMDELQLAVSLPELDSVSSGIFIPLEGLADSPLLDTSLDALFVSGLYEPLLTAIAVCSWIACAMSSIFPFVTWMVSIRYRSGGSSCWRCCARVMGWFSCRVSTSATPMQRNMSSSRLGRTSAR